MRPAGAPRRPNPSPEERSLNHRSTRPAAVSLLAVSLALGLLAGCGGRKQDAGPQVTVAPGAPHLLPEHYQHSIAALGWPGAKRAFQVGHGSVVFGGDAAIEWWVPGAEVETTPVYFEQDGVPVAHWTMTAPEHRIEFEAAAAPLDMLGDTSLVLSVRATLTRTAAGTGEVRFEARVRDRPDGPHWTPWDAVTPPEHDAGWQKHGAFFDGRLVAAVDDAANIPAGAPSRAKPTRVESDTAVALRAVCRATLARGESRAWHFVMPAHPVDADAADLRKAVDHEAIVSLARRAWRGWLDEAVQLATPDTLVNAAWRAALVTLIQSQEKFGDDWVSIGNPFQYRDVWIRDGARVVRALAVAGLTDRAKANAWAFRRFQLPPGAFLSQRGQLDGTGQALWAFEQVASLPPDPETAKRYLPMAREALDWIARERRGTRLLEMRHDNLLPFGDPRDAELVRAQLAGNDAWAIAGCRAVVTLARRAGDDDLARRAYQQYEDYLGAFNAALKRVFRDDVPPSWQGVGRDWGNVAAGYPTFVVPHNDIRMLFLARRVWAPARGLALVNYGSADSLHSYLGADLAQWALLAGRAGLARGYVDDLLDHSSSTLGQAELFHRGTGGFGLNMPPHTTAAATLIDLLRNMVVSDSRDTLDIALGGDLSWWNGTRFAKAPTRFGTVDVVLQRPAGDELAVEWGTSAAPVRIRIPDDAVAIATLTPGTQLDGGRWLHAPAGITRAAVRIREIR
jgi:hypothetical protein